MPATLCIKTFNGKKHISVENAAANTKRLERSLGELERFPLTDAQAGLSLNDLRRLYEGGAFR